MAFNPKTILKKTLKYTGIGMASILLLMFLLPYLFPSFVSNKIKQWANSSIQAELNFSKARLPFFNLLRRGRKSDELKETKPDEDSDEEDKKEAAEAAAREKQRKRKCSNAFTQ
jgi:hypothetical protein